MKINELHIDGFGIFNSYSVNPLKPGINLLMGDNEAGKTTLMKFIRYTLFGYPSTIANRMEPSKGGLHGGRIKFEASGTSYVIRRESGPSGGKARLSLTGSGDELSYDLDSILQNASGELFKNVYAFSLDELVGIDSLEASGVQDKIFSIGLGLGETSISTIESEISKKAEDIYKARGKIHKKAKLLKEIHRINGEVKAIQNLLPEYKALNDEIDELEIEIHGTNTKYKELVKAGNQLEHFRQSYSHYVEIKRSADEIVTLPESRDYPADGIEKLQTILSDNEQLGLEVQELIDGSIDEKGTRAIDEEMAAITVRKEFLSYKNDVDFLRSGIETYRQTLVDKEGEESEVEKLNRNISEDLRQISNHWTEDFVLEFSEESAHRERLEQFKERLDKLETQRIQLERDITNQNIPSYSAERIIILEGMAFIIVSIGLLLYGLLLFALVLFIVGIIMLVGSRFLDVRAEERRLATDLKALEKLQDAESKKLTDYLSSELMLVPHYTPGGALGVLNSLRSIKNLIDQRNFLNRTIEERRNPVLESFQSAVKRLGPVFNCEIRLIDETATRVIDEFDKDSAKFDLVSKLSDVRANLERRKSAKETNLTANNKRLRELFVAAGAEDESVYRKKIEANNMRNELNRLIKSKRDAIANIAGLDAVDGVINYLDLTTLDDLESEIVENNRTISDLEVQKEESAKDLGAKIKEKQLIEGESELTSKQTDLETVKNQLQSAYEEWLTCRMALKILNEVKAEFEKERQPAVITNSSKHFESITNGAYKRIAVSLEKKGNVAVFDDREDRKSIEELSRGTKEQLLISLRLGFIEDYEKQSEPLPIIVDDVFVNFDDNRAERTAKIIHEFSQDRQVLIFTCHPRTRDFFGEAEVNYIDVQRC